MLTELTEARVFVCVCERERVSVFTRTKAVLCGVEFRIFCLSFFSFDIFIYAPLMGTAWRENTELCAFQQLTVAKSGV